MKTLRGKPLEHWGPGLGATYEEFRNDTDIDDRLARLEALSDEQFATLQDDDIAQWVDASQGWGDDFPRILADALPTPAPVPPFTTEHMKAFLWTYEPDHWPIVSVRNPWEPLVVGGRDQIMSGEGEYPMDAMSSQPQLWWMPHGNKSQPHLQLGFWPADGSQPLQLTPNAASLHTHMSHSLMPHYVPPKPGWIRVRVGGWDENRQRKDRDGEWAPPVALTHVFVSTNARKAWTPTYIDDVPDSEMQYFRSGGGRFAAAQRSDLLPSIPIEVVGEAGWTPPAHEAPRPIESDWTPPPLPDVSAAAPAVSDAAREWLASRAKRYGNSRSTGRFWRELAEALA